MKQQDKLGFQNGARNALKMFEIVIDICMYTYIPCTISDGHSAELLCALYGQKPYKLLVSSNYTRIFLLAMKKKPFGQTVHLVGIAQA